MEYWNELFIVLINIPVLVISALLPQQYNTE